MNYTALKELENFVSECQIYYSLNKIIVGSDDNEWDTCHHPDPKCLGGKGTTKLLKKHHAIHGVLQSEAYEHPCIWSWEREYLVDPEHIKLYEKWMSESGRIAGRIGGKIGGVVIHSEKNDEGKSLRALELNRIVHAEKNEDGQSIHSLENNRLIHEEKNDKGQSVHAVKAGEESAKKTRKPVLLTELKTGETYLFPSVHEAARQLKLHQGNLSGVLNGKIKQTKGFTAVFI